jgi:hypothetical protein
VTDRFIVICSACWIAELNRDDLIRAWCHMYVDELAAGKPPNHIDIRCPKAVVRNHFRDKV